MSSQQKGIFLIEIRFEIYDSGHLGMADGRPRLDETGNIKK